MEMGLVSKARGAKIVAASVLSKTGVVFGTHEI